MITPAIPPFLRILRTLVQLLVAFPAIVPALVQVLHVLGVESISGPGLLAVAAAALALVVGVQNLLEQAGLIPTLGGDPTPVLPASEAVNIIDLHASGPHIREAQAEILAAAGAKR
ncbi:hypothetical protein KSP35_12995 [Aquihabitans sp. G128]|uniref:hypothetical protein n=1 Tax=Aquihabitans sp. G128 TaxID=2849779 RepID=UPI001C2508C6|nr:hypothetical protein [Aquihabitans sp. G128]QXC59319.1 hypothetical protein KSP35_12995 [Aquihabitans sp. G128]